MSARPTSGLTVRDVMVADVVTIDAGASLLEAAQRMRDANVGVLPVLEDGELAGVITDRDLVVRGMALRLSPMDTPVSACTSRSPICASPGWDVEQAREVMAQERVGRLPVIDGDGRVVGIVTLGSLALRLPDARTLDAAQEVTRRSARQRPAA